MHWIIIALLAALFNSLKNIAIKKVSYSSDQYTVAWAKNLLSLPFLYGALVYAGIPSVDSRFWLLIIVMMPFEIAINLLFYKAIKDEAISKVIPFVSFLPVFVAISAFIILGESLTSEIIFAIILLSIGAYIMNAEKATKKDILIPLKTIFTNTGSLLIVLVTIIWAILTPLGKLATEYSSAYFFTAIYFSLSTILFTPIFLRKSDGGIKIIKKHIVDFGLVGLYAGLFLVSTWVAISIGPTAAVKALTELGVPLTVLFAGTLLKEKGLKKRLLASLIMFTGAVLIILGS